MWFGEFVGCRQIQPYLEQLYGIVSIPLQQWEHFCMQYAFSGCEPLNVAFAIPSGAPERIRMIKEPMPDDCHRLKPAMRVLGKSRNGLTVVHAPAILSGKILSEIAAGQRYCGAEIFVSSREIVPVVYAEKEWIQGLPSE